MSTRRWTTSPPPTGCGAWSASAQDRSDFVRPDIFGYQTDAACIQQFVDIAVSGSPVALSDSDDGGGTVSLSSAFSFYGTSHSDLVVSSNGYLAFAADLAGDAGTDFSNDCALPAVPDQGPAVPARVMVLHDDLEAVDGASAVASQYFASCPRASDSRCVPAPFQ